MSYNHYSTSSPYSPYYQQSGNQQSQHQSTNQLRNSEQYSYQPLSAYQSGQQQQPASSQSNDQSQTYSTRGYGTSQARTGYNARTAVDTNALGNLAYASSLGQRGSSSGQQNLGYNHLQNPQGYGGVNYAMNSSHERTNSNSTDGAHSSRESYKVPTSTASPSFGYSSNSNTNSRPQATVGGSGVQGQYTALQQTRPPPPLPYQTQPNRNNQPSRYSSGQAVQRPQSRTATGLRSPPAPANQPVLSNIVNQPSKDSQTGTTPQQPTAFQKAAALRDNHTLNTTRNVMGSTNSHSATAPTAVSHSKNPPAQKPQHCSSTKSGARQATRENQNKSPISQNSTPVNQSVTTVDPSHVFNDLEYQKRQKVIAAESEAAARRKADNDMVAALGKAKEATSATTATLIGNIGQADREKAEIEKKNQMEQEMKAMIEKMRDYKSKDPTLFSQVWEDVKKAPPSVRAPSHSAAQGSVSSPVVVDSQGLGPAPAQLPPESELPAAESFPEGFDRGRYPAQRRRRGNSHYTPPRKPASKGSTKSSQENESLRSGNGQDQQISDPQPGKPAIAQMIQSNVNHQTQKPVTAATPPPTIKSATSEAPRPATGTTYWPEDKKHQLAEAARDALTKSPNNGKVITADELHHLLDQNPSYTAMCEILEGRGFVIDRGQFARTLLNAVPDLGSSSSNSTAPKQQPPAPPPPQPPLPHGLPVLTQSSKPIAYTGPHRYPQPLPYGHPTATQQHNGAIPGTAPAPTPPLHRIGNNLFVPATQFSSPQYPPSQFPPSHYPPPAGGSLSYSGFQPTTGPINPETQSMKQDFARKRKIEDIVDLTQSVSDDEADNILPRVSPYNKRARISELNHNKAEVSSDNALDQFRHNPSAAKGGKYLQSRDVVHPMNKRQDALRRSSYNPKTIARDILITLGKHPTMVPLNSHLDKLRENFAAVNWDSDLSTFRWDLADPGGPSPPEPPAAQQTPDPHSEAIKAAVKVREDQAQSASSPISPFESKRTDAQSSPAVTSSGPKRKGRPPGAKNKNGRPDKGVPKKSWSASKPHQYTPGPSPDIPALQSETPSRSPITKIPERPRIKTTPLKSSGLRNAMSPSGGIAVVIPSPSPSVAASRTGSEMMEQSARRDHPRRLTNDIPSQPPPMASYQIYKCEWENCPAKLHSPEKLKKHTRKHRKEYKDGAFPCLWKGCHSNDFTVPHIPAVNSTSERERLQFRSEDAWDQHVDVHIEGLAKDLGGEASSPLFGTFIPSM